MAFNLMPTAPPSATVSALPEFPDDVPTAPLVTIPLTKLFAGDKDEHARLFSASKALGFFYLDMRGNDQGESLLQDRDAMFALMEEFYALPEEERAKCDFTSQGNSFFGYKAMGKEVIDKNGTRDRNMRYNVSLSSSSTESLTT